ncbi:MAG: MscL family protein [Coriobacteriales bacterium]
MSFKSEFKEFISRGSVMDMAVGIIIGGAFTAIVTSLVEKIIQPIISMLGGSNLEGLGIALPNGGFIDSPPSSARSSTSSSSPSSCSASSRASTR